MGPSAGSDFPEIPLCVSFMGPFIKLSAGSFSKIFPRNWESPLSDKEAHITELIMWYICKCSSNYTLYVYKRAVSEKNISKMTSAKILHVSGRILKYLNNNKKNDTFVYPDLSITTCLLTDLLIKIDFPVNAI